MNQLDTVYLHVTKACNLQCIYCYFSAGNPEDYELNTSEIVAVLEEISSLKPEKIVFTGGEPLLRNDLIGLAQICESFNTKSRLALTTNGSLIDQNNAADLVQSFQDIRISIDGPEEINDRLRGAGSYQKAMNAFELIIKNGGSPQAFITVTALNQDYLEPLMRLLLSKQIFNIHFSPVKPVGRAENMDLIADEEQFTATITRFFKETFGLELQNKKKEALNCGIGKYLTIQPDGALYPCHMLVRPEYYIGNVRKEKLSSIYNQSPLLNKLRTLQISDLTQCAACSEDLTSAADCLGLALRSETQAEGVKSAGS